MLFRQPTDSVSYHFSPSFLPTSSSLSPLAPITDQSASAQLCRVDPKPPVFFREGTSVPSFVYTILVLNYCRKPYPCEYVVLSLLDLYPCTMYSLALCSCAMVFLSCHGVVSSTIQTRPMLNPMGSLVLIQSCRYPNLQLVTCMVVSVQYRIFCFLLIYSCPGSGLVKSVPQEHFQFSTSQLCRILSGQKETSFHFKVTIYK